MTGWNNRRFEFVPLRRILVFLAYRMRRVVRWREPTDDDLPLISGDSGLEADLDEVDSIFRKAHGTGSAGR